MDWKERATFSEHFQKKKKKKKIAKPVIFSKSSKYLII